MELFDNNNPEYLKALAMPLSIPTFSECNKAGNQITEVSEDDLFNNNPEYDKALPKPDFEPIFKLNSRYVVQNKNVDWTHLQPLNSLLFKNTSEYFPNIQDKTEDGMLEVYNTQEHKNEFQMLSEIKYFKRTKITARKQKEFPSQFFNIYKELDKQYELEMHLQRGINPFLHIPNYVQPITVYANFSSSKNQRNISDLLEKLYLPNKIVIYMKNNDIDSNYQGKFNKVEITKKSLKESVQIIYYKINEKNAMGEQLWECLKIIHQNLNEGGCFVFELKNLANPHFTQFLYLFQKLFLVISIDHNDYLTLTTKISCYGFQKNTSINILDKVFSNQDKILMNNFKIFRLRDLTQDSKFEYEIARFYKRYLQKISQQNKLIQHFNDANEITYQEFNQECQRLKERMSERKNKNNNDKPYREYKAENNNFQNSNTKVLNQKKEFFDLKINVETYKPQWKAAPKKEQEKKSEKQIREEQEKKKLEQLLSGGSSKKQSTIEILQKQYNEKLNLKGKKEYKTTAQDRRKKH